MNFRELKFIHQKNKQSGVIAVEFAMTIPVLFLLLLFFLEICRIISLCAVIDLALAESGRYTARTTVNTQQYKSIFEKHLRENRSSLLNYFLPDAHDKDIGINVFVTYCESVNDIIKNTCNNDPSNKFAIYNINYRYKPLFLGLPNIIKSKIGFDRKIVYLQELAR